MMMQLVELTNLFKNAVADGVEKSIFGSGLQKDRLTKSQAYCCYGRCNADRLQSQGLINISQKTFDRQKLEAIAASSNRITYLPMAER